MVMLCCSAAVFGQSRADVVTLKNGSVIKGEIIEQVPGVSLKLKTRDQNVFVYQFSEIEKIEKEQRTASVGRHKGLDFGATAGYDINTEGGGGAVTAEVELGKRFSPSIYWGIGAGASFATTSAGDITVPITTNLKVFFPIENASVQPFAMLKAGYSLNPDNTEYGGVLLQIMPGVQLPVSKTVDLNLGAGYTHVLHEGGGGGAISVRMGFNFHNSPDHVRHPKPLLPSKAGVGQITLEAGGFPFGVHEDNTFSFGGLDVVASYKFTPQLAFGVGAGYHMYSSEGESYDWNSDDIDLDGKMIRLFARGQYRLSDRRFAPFVACDLGFRLLTVESGEDRLERIDASTSLMGLFVAQDWIYADTQ